MSSDAWIDQTPEPLRALVRGCIWVAAAVVVGIVGIVFLFVLVPSWIENARETRILSDDLHKLGLGPWIDRNSMSYRWNSSTVSRSAAMVITPAEVKPFAAALENAGFYYAPATHETARNVLRYKQKGGPWRADIYYETGNVYFGKSPYPSRD